MGDYEDEDELVARLPTLSPDPAPSPEGAPAAEPVSHYRAFVAREGLTGRMQRSPELSERMAQIAAEPVTIDSALLRRHKQGPVLRPASPLPLPSEQVREELAAQPEPDDADGPADEALTWEEPGDDQVRFSPSSEESHTGREPGRTGVKVIDFLGEDVEQDVVAASVESADLTNREPEQEVSLKTGHDMATSRITAALESFGQLGELERDYVLDELRLVSKSMQLRALDGMSQYEDQARKLADRLAAEKKKSGDLSAELGRCNHALTEAQYRIEALEKALGQTDSEGGAVAEVTFESNGGAPVVPVTVVPQDPVIDEGKPLPEAEQVVEVPDEPAPAPILDELDEDAAMDALPSLEPAVDPEEQARLAAQEAFPDEDPDLDEELTQDEEPELYDDVEIPDFEPDFEP